MNHKDPEIIYEIFTVCGWEKVDRETYWDYKGRKRWRWKYE